MAIRLSKRELTERDRVLAWLNNQPFTTSQRVKATVPILTPAEVREKYSPLDPQATGQFFTPDAMAVAAMSAIEATGLLLDGSILEPCAGLGALLAPLEGKQFPVTAFELDQTYTAIGARLAPWAAWTNDNPFDHLAELEGRFDWVIANPPLTRDGAWHRPKRFARAGQPVPSTCSWSLLYTLGPCRCRTRFVRRIAHIPVGNPRREQQVKLFGVCRHGVPGSCLPSCC